MVRYRPVVKDEKLKRLAEGHPDFSDSLRRVVQRLQEMPAATLQADRMDVTNGNVGQPLAAVTQGVHDLDVSGFVVERALRDLAKQSHSLVLIFEEVLACLAKGRGLAGPNVGSVFDCRLVMAEPSVGLFASGELTLFSVMPLQSSDVFLAFFSVGDRTHSSYLQMPGLSSGIPSDDPGQAVDPAKTAFRFFGLRTARARNVRGWPF